MKTSIKSQVRQVVLGLAVAGFAGAASAVDVWDGSLPAAGDPLTSQQYQDFTIYSLNYLSNLAIQSPSLGLTSPTYNVPSDLGALHEPVVLVTGNTGTASSNTDSCGATGCDNAYDYPPPGATYFSSFTLADPNVVVPGELGTSTWTAQTSALRTFLNGSDMVFMFNLNEDNGTPGQLTDPNSLEGQSLLVSMRVQLLAADGVTVLYSFYVGANNAIGLPSTAAQVWTALGAPDPTIGGTTVLDTNTVNGWISTDPRWAYVHGAISVDTTTGVFLAMGDCNFSGFANCTTINQNLGANQVAFSAFNQQLSDLISDTNVAFMNVDMLTSGQSNGFEQLFIMAANIPTRVPEPGSLALAGLALAAVGVIRRRRPSTRT